MPLKDLIESARNVTLFCVDTLLTLMWRGSPHPNRVLVVRLDAIGDFVLWMDAAKATVSYYKCQGKTVVLVANALWARWARELSIFDDVIALEKRKYEWNLLYRFRLAYRIRMLGCATALHPTFSRELLFGDSVVRVSGAIERIGSSGDTSNVLRWQKRVSDTWYTRLIYSNPAPKMELLRNAEFLRGLGATDYQAKVADLRATVALELDDSFSAAITTDQKYYVMFPGASWNGKQWPAKSFARIAEQLYGRTGWHGVVCGVNAEHKLAVQLCSACGAPLLNWAGRTDLLQLTAILAAAQILVTNDTSSAHIAAAVGIPSVCILGGGHYGRFLPYQVERMDSRPLPRTIIHPMPCFGCNWRCIYELSNGAPVPCIEKIGVTEVWKAIESVLRIGS